MSINSISVIGGGSWATALVKILSNGPCKINWWLRNTEAVEHILKYRHNPHYLSDVEHDLDKVQPTTNLVKAIENSDWIILAVPAAFLKDTLKPVSQSSFQGRHVFSAIKGIVPSTNQIVGEYMNSTYGIPLNNIGVITGPCHAEEVALEKLSYLTIACPDNNTANELGKALTCRYIRTVISDDIYGTEYAAVLKNIMAVASGIYHGLGYGDNFQAVLISNGIREIKRFVDAVHPIQRDINDSAYLGDLLVTAYSQFSRNRTFGSMIGKGYTVKSAQLEMNMIAEGYYAVAGIHEIIKQHNISMPITESVYRVLYEHIAPRIEMRLLTDSLS
jgi:glycerol-3-phosphate dehydrogenase (NAD(P)+)